MSAEFVERRCTNSLKLASGQCRLEHARSVDSPLGSASTHGLMQLIEEQNKLTFGGTHLVDDCLEALLEFAAELRPSHHGPHINCEDLAVVQNPRHLTVSDPLGQALDDGRLADARLTDEHRVVLCASRKHLNNPLDLLLAAYDRIELSRTSNSREVGAVFLQDLIPALGRRGG